MTNPEYNIDLEKRMLRLPRCWIVSSETSRVIGIIFKCQPFTMVSVTKEIDGIYRLNHYPDWLLSEAAGAKAKEMEVSHP